MRIIGGDARGRIIYSPKQSQMRPTSDGIKESLFNILHAPSGKSFVDLFAGCGSVGLEALSRGAAQVVFVEKNTAMVNAIKRNLRELSLGGKYEIMAIEAARAIRKLQNRGESLDVVFADPPYERGFVREIFRGLSGGNVLSEDGVLIIQHSVRENVEEQYTGDFILTDRRRYGDTHLSFFKIREKE
ncbi:MAG: 16S rRNA (guanine(966)-N(2))-methyltransferase RsmD [Syntrophales bacterium]